MPKKLYHKFHAKPVESEGIKFSSKKEAAYYQKLKELQKSGEVLFFLRQIPFYLSDNKSKYVCDFLVFSTNGEVEFIDCKGFKTETYKLKKRLVEAQYPITIEER